jgi:hypothetical protein
VQIAGGDALGPGQRRSVEHDVGAEFARRVAAAVGEQQAAFGVGVVDLDRFARVQHQHVVGLVGGRADRILG